MIINANSIEQHVIQIKNEMIHVNACVKSILSAKRYYSWNPSTDIRVYSKYLKSIDGTSKIVCDEIINVTDSANVINTIPTNVTSSWYPLVSKKIRNKIQVAQNRCICFFLKLNSRHH